MTEQEMRNCPKCGKEINAEATRCMYCFAKSDPVYKTTRKPVVQEQGDSLPVAPPPTGPRLFSDTSADPSRGSIAGTTTSSRSAAVVYRYRDAYAIASTVVQWGQTLKTLAIVSAAVVFLPFVFVATRLVGAMPAIMAGSMIVLFVYGVIHAHAVRVAAEGQHLLASLDIAVNTSPFLTDDDRAYAMSLS